MVTPAAPLALLLEAELEALLELELEEPAATLLDDDELPTVHCVPPELEDEELDDEELEELEDPDEVDRVQVPCAYCRTHCP